MSGQGPQIVIATYRVQARRMDEFMGLLRSHYPTLRRLGLVTGTPPVVYRGEEDQREGGGPIVFEIFEWVDGEAAGTAHQTPEVARIWEAMGAMVERRGGRPDLEFPHVERVDVAWGS